MNFGISTTLSSTLATLVPTLGEVSPTERRTDLHPNNIVPTLAQHSANFGQG